MRRRKLWSLKFTSAAWVLIPIAVGINYIGKTFASTLKLPLWLDSIGTVLAGFLAGPIIGALAGLVNNIVYGLTLSPIAFVYGLTSIFIGFVAGFFAYREWISSWLQAVTLGVLIGFVAILVSTPLNIFFWEGQTGNLWGDALFAFSLAKTSSIWISSFLSQFVIDLPDKIVTVLLSYAILLGLPQNLQKLYQSQNQIESLD